MILSLRTLLRHPIQFALMTIGIALGVAVMVGIDLANASAERAFELSANAITGRATHAIVASSGVEEELYTHLRTDPTLKSKFESAPTVRTLVISPQLGQIPFTLLGIDPFAEVPFRSYLGGDQAFNFQVVAPLLSQPGSILLSEPVAKQYGLTACKYLLDDTCRIELLINGIKHNAYIVGLLEPSNELARRALDTLMISDISTAQSLSGTSGKLTQIDLIIPEGYDTSKIADALPPGNLLVTSATRNDQVNIMTEAFRVNLTALSLLALVVGIFLIYNTMTFSVVQRRALFGTLRSIGYSREQVFGMVIGEAAMVGAIGAFIGIGLGVFLGQVAVKMVTQTINDLFFIVSVRGVQISTSSLIKGGVAGLLASILAAAPPAWEAASVPPRLALSRAGLETKAGAAVNLSAVIGILAAIFGSLILLIPTRNLIISFVGTFAIIIGIAGMTPFVTVSLMNFLSAPLANLFGLLGRLAPRNVVRSQSRTAIAVAALMIAVSVTIGVQVMIASFRTTVSLWLDQTLVGDIYISAEGLSATRLDTPLDPKVVSLVQRHPLVESGAVVRVVNVETEYGPVDLVAATPTQLDPRILLSGNPDTVSTQMRNGAVLLSEPLAARLSFTKVGGSISVLSPNGWIPFTVVGIYADYASTRGTIRMDIDLYRSIWKDSTLNGVSLTLVPTADVDAVTADLRGKLIGFDRVQVNPSGALRIDALETFDRTFAITTAMQLITTLVAFIGVLSSLLSLQLEKAREMGILRAIGLTISEMRQLTFWETGLLGASAGVLALPTGYILAWILIFIINQRSFGWTLRMLVEPAPFLQAFILAVSAALLAAVFPAWRLSQIQTAEALRGD